MSRLNRFEAMNEHAMNGTLYRRLSKDEREKCREFIRQNDHLDRNAFAEKANRWMLDEVRPKRYADMWALVLQANI